MFFCLISKENECARPPARPLKCVFPKGNAWFVKVIKKSAIYENYGFAFIPKENKGARPHARPLKCVFPK
jgi:hypothetical protein